VSRSVVLVVVVVVVVRMVVDIVVLLLLLPVQLQKELKSSRSQDFERRCRPT
jgi:hypothetical protein